MGNRNALLNDRADKKKITNFHKKWTGEICEKLRLRKMSNMLVESNW